MMDIKFMKVASRETNTPFRFITILLVKEDKTIENNRYDEIKEGEADENDRES